jgi:hypothetical protein
MAATKRFDVELRAIGQALEASGISVFELKRLGDNYIVQGEPDETGAPESRLRRWFRRLRRGPSIESMTLGLADVERLTALGRARRSEAGRLPNFQSVSSLLRTLGAYLDDKEAELLRIEKRRISITLWYQDRTGQKQEENRTISSFHPMFVELCGRRGHLQQTPPQTPRGSAAS